MKSSKNSIISKKEITDIMDLIIQSTIVSGQDDIVRELYQCEQYFDKVPDEKKSDVIKRLYKVAADNERNSSKNKSENLLWKEILKILQK
jgi:hypothetical protein